MTEHRFGNRTDARLELEHLDQPSRDTGRLDRRMRRDGGVGLLHEVHPARAILFEDLDCAEREIRRFDYHRVHLIAEHRFESRLQPQRRAHYLFEDRRIDGGTIAVERFKDRAESQIDAVGRNDWIEVAVRAQHATQRIDARGQMIERRARLDLALRGPAPRPFELGRRRARRFQVRFRRAHQFARGLERGCQRRCLDGGRGETLFEFRALAGKIAQPAPNNRRLANDVGQVVLAFLAAALGLLEFAIGSFVLEGNFL